MSNIWGGVLAATGFIACPCHLPFTLPLLIGVLGGTGIGAGVAANIGLIYVIATGYFILAIGVGVFLLNRKKRYIQATSREIPLPGAAASKKRSIF